MYNTVCIVTNFRCASTSFNLLKAEEYDLPYKGELFSHERSRNLGNAPSLWKLRRENKEREVKYSNEELIYLCRDEAFLEELRKGEPCCFKVMPSHIKTDDMLYNIVSSCDKVYYLYRRDFKAQLSSYLAARMKGDWIATGFKRKSRPNTHEMIKDTHLGTNGKGETVVRNLDPFQNMKLRRLLPEQLINNYIRMAELYKQIPGELICAEDYFTKDKYNPYNRKINWTKDPNFEDFDVEGLFVDNK